MHYGESTITVEMARPPSSSSLKKIEFKSWPNLIFTNCQNLIFYFCHLSLAGHWYNQSFGETKFLHLFKKSVIITFHWPGTSNSRFAIYRLQIVNTFSLNLFSPSSGLALVQLNFFVKPNSYILSKHLLSPSSGLAPVFTLLSPPHP